MLHPRDPHLNALMLFIYVIFSVMRKNGRFPRGQRKCTCSSWWFSSNQSAPRSVSPVGLLEALGERLTSSITFPQIISPPAPMLNVLIWLRMLMRRRSATLVINKSLKEMICGAGMHRRIRAITDTDLVKQISKWPWCDQHTKRNVWYVRLVVVVIIVVVVVSITSLKTTRPVMYILVSCVLSSSKCVNHYCSPVDGEECVWIHIFLSAEVIVALRSFMDGLLWVHGLSL